MFGTCNTVEVELAEQICRMVPCAELVRFGNSGSEVIQGAVRAARGFTGRTKILKFEGHYHGWVDTLAVSNRPTRRTGRPGRRAGQPPALAGPAAGVVGDVVICPWNRPDVLRRMLAAGDVAAVIAEPIVANNACIGPADGFLEAVRDACSAHGTLLIFDEIVTGFRVAAGGAQELFGVVPDLAVYSKAIGGGLPIAAFAGRRDVMDLIAVQRGQARRHVQRQPAVRHGRPAHAAAAGPGRRAGPPRHGRRGRDGGDPPGGPRPRRGHRAERRGVDVPGRVHRRRPSRCGTTATWPGPTPPGTPPSATPC